MKKAQREVYLTLANEAGWGLCAFCKYHVCYSSPCSGDSECTHPLQDRVDSDMFNLLEPRSDCWGFRPRHSLRDLADIVGVVLSQDWRDKAVMWQSQSDGRILVYGGNWQ